MLTSVGDETVSKLEIHQGMVDVLLASGDVLAAVTRTGLGQTQMDEQLERLRRVETLMESVVDEASEVYREDGGGVEGAEEIVRRVSGVVQAVKRARKVVSVASARRRFTSGVDRGGSVGRRWRDAWDAGRTDEGAEELADLVSGPEEASTDEMEDSLEEDEHGSQESDDEIPE